MASPASNDGVRPVSDRHIHEYRERGFWVAPKLISDAQIARLNRAHDRIWAGEVDGEGFYYEGKRPDVDRTSPAVRKIQNGGRLGVELNVE